MRALLFQLLILLFLFSCTSPKGKSTGAVYANYAITAEEGGENATCLFRFFEGSRAGATLVLEPPAQVLLDGVAVAADSARLSGAYYEVQRPLAGFAGAHTIVFRNAEAKTHTERFTFQPFNLTTALAGTVQRGAIALRVTGLQSTDYLRVLLTDTSFATPDINDIDTVRNGTLVISPEALQNVANGPVTLNLIREQEWPLQDPPGRGGKLSITYSLSREFELVE